MTDAPASSRAHEGEGESQSQALSLRLDGGDTVSALWLRPASAHACVVFAHGAGAGMRHAFMAAFAEGLAGRGIATLRFQFPYMERSSKRPDAPAVAHATVRAAVAEAAARSAGLPLFAGGKSFGGRMTSQAQASQRLPGVRGIVFVAFPLHPAGRPSLDRAVHLDAVRCPMLFLQGTRDELADFALLKNVVDRLGSLATLEAFADADHAFHVRARSGGTDLQVREAMLDATARWIIERAAAGPTPPGA